ncbi:BofC C-terminal domain-containing protein [Paenibacillus thalictri]|uniref:Bypass-of-forespore protein C n=1 Tax=Paenibacillus thalictri TaxID=2527873 RepID=A0A4Q9DWZ8_9BACL|nr:BofC C-terminal domain-containing protein [Paenibacillus thalictri]TBL81609.1 bypass-of-forespore protein C [Paenibacillus thalictri]
MIFLSWFKQLKKKLRARRRSLAFGLAFLVLCGASVWLYGKVHEPGSGGKAELSPDRSVFGYIRQEPVRNMEEQIAVIKNSRQQRETFIKKSYICGEELQSLGLLQPDDILKYAKEHPDLALSLDEAGKVYFVQTVEDLSQQCKEHAYFGLDEKGNLSLFNGVPGKDNVIRTFFQLNINFLKSSLPLETVDQLYSGIRVTDLDEYNSIISTFSDYAVEETEKVMTQPDVK